MRSVVLLIDENDVTTTLVMDALRDNGFVPIPCRSGAEALDWVSRARPVACLVDHVMLAISATEFVRALRNSANTWLRRQPVVALRSAVLSELLESGPNLSIEKPLCAEAVRKALDQIVQLTATVPGTSA